MKSKLTLSILVACFASISLSAKTEYTVIDGAIQLPTFFVYASDSDETSASAVVADTNWEFQKSLDLQSSSTVTIVGPDNKELNIALPNIQVSLVGQEIERG